jgi:hypothetical protein
MALDGHGGAVAMGHFQDARALVAHCRQAILRLEGAYRDSLTERAVKTSLLIEIKNVMENLRSALDYSAAGLSAKYGLSSCRETRTYFPYAQEKQTVVEFRQAKRTDVCIPGLSAHRPDIVAKLESYQWFADLHNAWLPRFMDLNNENKHQNLTPQVRRETKELRISSGNVTMSVGQGASISIGERAFVQLGGALTIPGGQTFDVKRPPLAVGPGRMETVTWVSFHFACNGEPVLPFLKKAVDGVDGIVTELAQM